MNGRAEIVLVHGLWFGSWAMARLARLLEADGFRIRRFDYPSTAGGLQSHADKLLRFAGHSAPASLHFVGHSLGGLVILKMLAAGTELPPGRVTLLGSPLDGSRVVRRSRRVPYAENLLGEVRAALDSGFSHLPQNRETGVIAGSRSLGLGWVVGGTGGPGDGTVAVRETRIEGLKDHLVLPVSHTGMLYSRKVARQTGHFLRTGVFIREKGA